MKNEVSLGIAVLGVVGGIISGGTANIIVGTVVGVCIGLVYHAESSKMEDALKKRQGIIPTAEQMNELTKPTNRYYFVTAGEVSAARQRQSANNNQQQYSLL